MEYLPLSVNVEDRLCVVVGGGPVALRKVQRLHQAKASLRVIASQFCQQFPVFDNVQMQRRAFVDEDVNGAYLVIAATNNRQLNQHIATLAKAQGALVNVVDQAALSDIVFPAVIDRSPINIAVSSEGKTPALLRLLRSQLEGLLPLYYGELGELFNRYRKQVKTRLPRLKDQRLFWKQLFHGKALQWLQSKDISKLEDALIARLEATSQEAKQSLVGSVALVGAGPGDPELLTLKAIRLIQWADVILYDRLVSPLVLDYAQHSAQRVYVGKKRNHHSVPQESINQLLIDYARAGKQVVRLKGGDPFVFGRGGEEIYELSEQGINFEVVPGISAANGCAAYAGIPLTHRDYAQSVKFVTGFLKDGHCELDWQHCLDPQQTLVVYMGSKSIDKICTQLIAHGRDPNTAIALIEQGTQLSQKVYVGNLDSFAQRIRDVELHAPTLLIIGDVVKLHAQLNWFSQELIDYS